MNRRTLLHGLAAAGATGLMGAVAGCMGGGGNGDGTTGGGGATTAAGGDGATTPVEQTTAGGGTELGTETTSGATPGGATGTPSTVTGGGTARPTVSVVSHPQLGNILVGPDGMTLYLFTEDSAGESVCYGDCASAWPPLLVEGEPTAGSGVTADLGTIQRRNGSTQVTVDGTPLYYYAPDEQPGDVTGQGVGGVWYVLAPDGSRVTSTGTDTGSATTTGTGGSSGSTSGGGINY